MEENRMKGKTNNPNGRPRISSSDRRVTISMRLKPSTIAWIDSESERTGESRTRIIEQLIETHRSN